MPQYEKPHPWRLETDGQVIDLETAVKDGILGGGGGDWCCEGDTATEKVDLKKMIDDLESIEDIPTVFFCPISLEPMVDPVTLCTGQTYERLNILKWSSMGNLTCPTTMQELWDDTVTPNLTLHHLILAWFSQRHRRINKSADDVSSRAIELLGALKSVKGQGRVRALKELQRLVAAHSSARQSVVESSNGIALISSLLGPFTSHAVGSEAIGILVNLPLTSESRAILMQPEKISLVVDMLNEGAIETKVNCTRFIEILMEDKGFRSEIVSSLSLLVGLLRLVKDRKHPIGISSALNLLTSICSHQQARGLVISIGAVPQIVELLPSLNPECINSALQVLNCLSSIPQGLNALKDCPLTIPNVVRLLMRVSESCTQYALLILSAVCKVAPDECWSIAVEAGLAAKLLLVIQSDCSPAVKQLSAELLKLCSVNYTETLFISKCNLTRRIH